MPLHPRPAALLLAAWLACCPTAAVAAACRAWPGEPLPLPTALAADAVAARWAALRARELVALAEEAAARSRALAYALRAHAACLDPRRPALGEILMRTPPVRVHRPVLVAAPPLRVARAGTADEAAALFERPIATPALAPPSARAERAPLPRAVLAAEQALRDARYEEALQHAAEARAQLAPGLPGSAAGRARLELAAAAAALALGREAEARSSFERALEANPALVLSPSEVSPKVRRLFEAVRSERSAAP